MAKDLGIKPEQLLIYDNVWDGAKEGFLMVASRRFNGQRFRLYNKNGAL